MLWGSRFEHKINSEAMMFSSSLKFDSELFEYDIKVSKAHVLMLCKCEIISKLDCDLIQEGLEKVKVHYKSEYWIPDSTKYEDIHSAIEEYLYDLIGETAGKLHSGRSRNDLVVTSFRLWMKDKLDSLKITLEEFIAALKKKAFNHLETVMPGYTHLQRAQPVSLAFHLSAYKQMVERDIKRLTFLYDEIDEMPLGSGALAGSTLKLDREYTAELLGFSKISQNAMDSISDRDFVIDFHNLVSIGMMHLSRLAEELILWSTKEFDFIKINDAYSTGSSLMPQKKNPDMAELVRGKNGRVYGNYISAITMMKGLPLSYFRDLQEDKEPVFDSFETYFQSIKIMTKMIETLEVKKDRFTEELDGSDIFATDLADKLVETGVPFREAHKIVGEIVNKAESKKLKLKSLNKEDVLEISSDLQKILAESINIDLALRNKKTFGSPNPDMVEEQISK